MREYMIAAIVAGVVVVSTGCSDDSPSAGDGSVDSPSLSSFSFFISSTGHPSGGNFGGLAGADEFCRMKAALAVPASANKMWRAYLSTTTVNAKDRIGAGPWFNRNGVMVAASVAALLVPAMNMINKQTGLDENGAIVPGRGDTPNQHDIITGTLADGTVAPNHCDNWTSSADAGVTAQCGHHDRDGGGTDPMSWSSAHATRGCAAASFPPTGGRGSIYCFAAD